MVWTLPADTDLPAHGDRRDPAQGARRADDAGRLRSRRRGLRLVRRGEVPQHAGRDHPQPRRRASAWCACWTWPKHPRLRAGGRSGRRLPAADPGRPAPRDGPDRDQHQRRRTRHEITQWVNAVAEAYVGATSRRRPRTCTRAVATIRTQIDSLQAELSEAEGERIDTLERTKIFNSESQEETLREKLKTFNADADRGADRAEAARTTAGADPRDAGAGRRSVSTARAGRRRHAAGAAVAQRSSWSGSSKREGRSAARPPGVREATKTSRQAQAADPRSGQAGDRRLADSDARCCWSRRRYLREQIDDAENVSRLQVAKATSRYDIVKTDAETQETDLRPDQQDDARGPARRRADEQQRLDPRRGHACRCSPIKPRKRVNLIDRRDARAVPGRRRRLLPRLPGQHDPHAGGHREVPRTVGAGRDPQGRRGLEPIAAVQEAYQSLRTSVIFSSKNRQRKVILITSTGPQEGKSSTVANLGRTLAAAGDRVIIVDCDLRRPTQHLHHELERDHGLTNYLAAPADETRLDRLRQADFDAEPARA